MHSHSTPPPHSFYIIVGVCFVNLNEFYNTLKNMLFSSSIVNFQLHNTLWCDFSIPCVDTCVEPHQPIPNLVVKRVRGDNTAGVALWKNNLTQGILHAHSLFSTRFCLVNFQFHTPFFPHFIFISKRAEQKRRSILYEFLSFLSRLKKENLKFFSK